MLEPKPNKQRASIAANFIWAILGVQIAFIIIGLLNVFLVSPGDMASMNSETSETTTLSYDTEASATSTSSSATTFETQHEPKRIAEFIDVSDIIVGLLYKLLLIGSSITFIMWFRRAYYNLYVRGIKMKYKDGWAAGSWFVPFLNLYRPYEMMKELFSVTKGLLMGRKGFSESKLSTKILNYWWALSLGEMILERIAKRWLKNATVDEIIPLSIMYVIVYVIGVWGSLVTIKLINNYSKAEQMLNKDENDDEFEPEHVLAYDSGFE